MNQYITFYILFDLRNEENVSSQKSDVWRTRFEGEAAISQ